MRANSQEHRQFLGKSLLFWGIISVITMAAFALMLACGLAFGAGALSALQLLQSDAQAAPIDVPESAADTMASAAEPAESTGQVEEMEVKLGIHKDTAVPPKIGNAASDFTLQDLQGNLITLSDFAGQPVLINFWATWCGPCEAEMPDINEAYLAHRDQGLVVLAVNLEEHPDTVKSFVNYYKLDFPILLDREKDVGLQYGARALPTSYFVDASGTIVYTFYGQMDEDDIALGLRKIMPQSDE